MAINEERRQLAVAQELESVARTLAHSTRTVPHPHESYALIGEIRATIDSLNQVITQLASWHKNAVQGEHYEGIDTDGYFTPGIEVSDERRAQVVQFDVGVQLEGAADELREAAHLLKNAHSASGAVRWYEDPRTEGKRS